jgi:ribosomal 50S subunit-associated protein YjgA (DUF615 family)
VAHPEVEEYLVRAFDMLKQDEQQQMDFFHDISTWREKYIMLQASAASCLLKATARWDSISRHTSSNICRQRRYHSTTPQWQTIYLL